MVVTFPHPDVTSRYLFGSPWIPELMFVVGKLDPEVLRLYHQERQEAYMSNQALYNMTYEETTGIKDAAESGRRLPRRSEPWPTA